MPRRPHRSLILASCAALATATGCAAGFSVGLGPRVDTEGAVGIELGAHGDFGMGVESQAILAEAGVGGGFDDFTSAAPSMGIDAGFAYQQELVFSNLALRGGTRARFQWRHDGEWTNAMGLGGVFAVLPTLRETDTWTEHLGAEVAGYWLSVSSESATNERDNRGLFSLMLVYSRLVAVAGPQLAFSAGR